jgi:hypothetical protein
MHPIPSSATKWPLSVIHKKDTMRYRTALLTLVALCIGSPFAHGQNGSLLFDGVDDRAFCANTALQSIANGPFTLEAWVRVEQEGDAGTHMRLLSNRTGVGVGLFFGFHALWGGSAYKMLTVQMNNHNYLVVNNGLFGASLLDNDCHHVAAVRDATHVRFYVDGSYMGQVGTFAEHTAYSRAQQMMIGDDPVSSGPFAGELSHLRIWNYARTEQEIADGMHAAITGNTPGLLGYWPMAMPRGR